MTDEQLEELLRGVRVGGPPPELRSRVVTLRPASRAWPWMAAAAALVALTVSLHMAAGRLLDDVRAGSASGMESVEDLAGAREALNLDDRDVKAIILHQELARRIRGGRQDPAAQ